MRADYYSRYFPEETSPAPVSSSGTAAPYAVRSDPGIAAPEKRKRRKGLRVFLICLALLIVCSAAAGGIWHFWVAPALEEDPVEQGGDFGENTTGHLSDNRARCDIERAPVPTGASVTISSVVGEELTLQQIYRKVNPSIVLVQAYDDFGGGGQGTGVALTRSGYVVTNFHIIDGCSHAQIVLPDDRVYQATLVGYDSQSDLAVLKIEAGVLRPAELGDSSKLVVGDEVCAIGNPLGEDLRGTMTDGIISFMDRVINSDGISMTLIQTTAALNEGNSGGALVNMAGQVVGITNMKMMSDYSTIEGLGFAIPSTTVERVVNALLEKGVVPGQPRLGMTVRQLQPKERLDMGVPEDLAGGLLIISVVPGSGAEAAGVRVGDIAVEANGRPLAVNDDLLAVRDTLAAGDILHLRYWRSGGYADVEILLTEQYELDQ